MLTSPRAHGLTLKELGSLSGRFLGQDTMHSLTSIHHTRSYDHGSHKWEFGGRKNYVFAAAQDPTIPSPIKQHKNQHYVDGTPIQH